MRIIGGKYRHRLISWPDNVEFIRPTKDRIRESIFNALGDIEGLVSLDLYSGSGSMGIESLSRGCKKAYFVDINPIAIKTTRNNILSLDINKEEYEILQINDVDALGKFVKENITFDLIFLDPPYKEGKYQFLIDYLIKNNLLTKKGIIVLEADKDLDFSAYPFTKIKKYTYGKIYVWILWR